MKRLFTLVLLALGCRVATVRPLESNGTVSVGAAPFDAAAYVDSIWSARVVPSIENSANDCAALLKALQRDPVDATRRFGRSVQGVSYFLAAGRGTVVEVDKGSRSGLIGLDVGAVKGKGQVDVWVQVGPVVNGSALRDAVGFISFDQFTNQIEFADVGNALNQKVLDVVVRGIDLERLKGSEVSFAGVLAPGERLVMTPVRLSAGRE